MRQTLGSSGAIAAALLSQQHRPQTAAAAMMLPARIGWAAHPRTQQPKQRQSLHRAAAAAAVQRPLAGAASSRPAPGSPGLRRRRSPLPCRSVADDAGADDAGAGGTGPVLTPAEQQLFDLVKHREEESGRAAMASIFLDESKGLEQTEELAAARAEAAAIVANFKPEELETFNPEQGFFDGAAISEDNDIVCLPNPRGAQPFQLLKVPLPPPVDVRQEMEEKRAAALAEIARQNPDFSGGWWGMLARVSVCVFEV